MFDEGLRGEKAALVIADGPTVRRRRARHAIEEVELRGAAIGRCDDGPRGPVPMLDQRMKFGTGVIADGPAVRRRHAGHAIKEIVLRAAGVG